MKRHWRKRLICCAAAASFLCAQASAYDFREEKMDGDLTAVQGYLEEMLRAGGTQEFALDFEKAVRIPYVEMEAWKTFLTAATQGEWTEIPAEQANWMIPAAREGGEKTIAMVMEPLDAVTAESGYSIHTTASPQYDFVFEPQTIQQILQESGFTAYEELRIYGILNEGSIFIIALQNGEVGIFPYTASPESWGVQNQSVYSAEDFYAAAEGYMEDALRPQKWNSGWDNGHPVWLYAAGGIFILVLGVALWIFHKRT